MNVSESGNVTESVGTPKHPFVGEQVNVAAGPSEFIEKVTVPETENTQLKTSFSCTLPSLLESSMIKLPLAVDPPEENGTKYIGDRYRNCPSTDAQQCQQH